MVGSEEKPYSVHLPSITHNGFLYKTPSMAKPISERKGPEGTCVRQGKGSWEIKSNSPERGNCTLPSSLRH